MKKATRALVLATMLTLTPQTQTVSADGELTAAVIGLGLAAGSAATICNIREAYKLAQIDHFFNAEDQGASLGKAIKEFFFGVKDHLYAFEVADKAWPVGPVRDPENPNFTNEDKQRIITAITTWKNGDPTYLTSPYTLILFTNRLFAENELLRSYKSYLTGRGTLGKTFNWVWKLITLPQNHSQAEALRVIEQYIERTDTMIQIIKNLPEYQKQAELYAKFNHAAANNAAVII